jgi:DNA-binding GntR family transcriptional regulator
MYTDRRDSGPARSAEQAVYDYLQAEILSGRLPAGSAIRQGEIAKQLSLSRIPVRDALRHLAAEGFVTVEANRRAAVTLLRPDDLSELYEIRAALEGLAARHAAKHLTDSEIDHLAWLAQRMDQTETNRDQWLPIHEQFHDLLCAGCRMPRLIQETRRLRKSLAPQVRVLILQSGVAELPTNHHRDLVKAIRPRDPARAEEAVRQHVQQAAVDIISAIKNTSKQVGVENTTSSRTRRATRKRIESPLAEPTT